MDQNETPKTQLDDQGIKSILDKMTDDKRVKSSKRKAKNPVRARVYELHQKGLKPNEVMIVLAEEGTPISRTRYYDFMKDFKTMGMKRK